MFNQVINLTKRLYPTGRAFLIPFGGVWDKVHRAFAEVEVKAVKEAKGVLDATLPDNDNFTADDAAAWELRLGLIVDTTKSLDDRKVGIKRKLNHPGRIPARQNYRYLERELRAAGFDVYVYENRFDDGSGGIETRTVEDIIGASGGTQNQLGVNQLGQAQLGTAYLKKAVWSIDDADKNFDVGTLQHRAFYISGDPITTQATVDASREREFRELIMKVKPVQTVAWLLVNYV